MNGAKCGDDGRPAGFEGVGGSRGVRVWVPVLAVVVAALAVVAAWPGGVGTPRPVEVVQGVSAAGYRLIAGAAAGVPWLHPLLDIVATGGLVALGVALLVVGWSGRGIPGRVAGVMLGLVATLVAYGGSEAVKLAVDEVRPCRAIDLGLAAICPPAGDWSFPSNHAACAGALAIALVMIRPRLGLAVGVPLALLVAVARVAEGVHYPHDVLVGLTCGAATAVVLLAALTPPLTRLPLLRPRPAP